MEKIKDIEIQEVNYVNPKLENSDIDSTNKESEKKLSIKEQEKRLLFILIFILIMLGIGYLIFLGGFF